MEWINIHDRLPEKNQIVLICHSETCILISEMTELIIEVQHIRDDKNPFVRTTIKKTIEWYRVNRNTFIDEKIMSLGGIGLSTEPIITHWMPLPEPPK